MHWIAGYLLFEQPGPGLVVHRADPVDVAIECFHMSDITAKQ